MHEHYWVGNAATISQRIREFTQQSMVEEVDDNE
jgi:hypothetical protein